MITAADKKKKKRQFDENLRKERRKIMRQAPIKIYGQRNGS